MMSNITDMYNMTNASNYGFADGCFRSYNKIACARDALEAVAALITAIFCIVKIVKLHIVKHELWNQYLIFYSALVEIVLLCLNWTYLHHAAIDLTAELLKLFQFMVVCRFYCEVAARLSKNENLYKRFLFPALVATTTYFLGLIMFALIRIKGNLEECAEPEWIQLSGSEVALGIISIVVGIFITKKTNNLKTSYSYKRNIKLSLWGIILSFQFSSLISFVYDLLMLFVGKQNRCKGIFIKDPAAFTICHLSVKIIKWLLPIWAMIIIYKPDSFKGSSVESADNPPIVHRSSVGVFKSEFRPRGKSFNYKHLRDPENEKERNLLAGSAADQVVAIKSKKKKRRNKSGGSSSCSPGSPRPPVKEKSPKDRVGINYDGADASERDPII